jgi:hypothetical protein
MPEDNFDKRMEDWTAGEIEAAPELRPTSEMYSLVESKGRRVRILWFQPHKMAAGMALAALLLLVIGGLILDDPAAWFRPAPVHQIAFVEQRMGSDIHPETPGKGKGRGNQSFQQLTLQVNRGAAGPIESFDLLNPITIPIDLTTSDDFRLQIQPTQTRNLYLFLVNPNNGYLALHPEKGFIPLHPEVATLLPSRPNWFYLSGESGAYHLLLITATHAVPELDELYNQYVQRSTGPDFESAQLALSEYLESITSGSAKGFEVWELTLSLQD